MGQYSNSNRNKLPITSQSNLAVVNMQSEYVIDTETVEENKENSERKFNVISPSNSSYLKINTSASEIIDFNNNNSVLIDDGHMSDITITDIAVTPSTQTAQSSPCSDTTQSDTKTSSNTN